MTRFRAMACPCEVRLEGLPAERRAAIEDEAVAEVLRIERKYSRYRDDSVTAAETSRNQARYKRILWQVSLFRICAAAPRHADNDETSR